MSRKTPGEVWARTCGTKSPSRSEALRFIDSSKSPSTSPGVFRDMALLGLCLELLFSLLDKTELYLLDGRELLFEFSVLSQHLFDHLFLLFAFLTTDGSLPCKQLLCESNIDITLQYL